MELARQAKVRDLRPGDVVSVFGERWCYISQAKHPIFKSLQLVIWRNTNGQWSLDALSREQTVGYVEGSETDYDRRQRLQKALIGEGRWE